MEKLYKMCTRCVMDTTADGIVFDENGVCNYCTQFLKDSEHLLNKTPEQKRKELNSLIKEIQENGKGKKYDCIVGVSGGVDSSWVLVKTVQEGLNPLAVHMDNGWNSELAQNNIESLVRKLDIDLFTYVIDWDEYRDLQEAFLKANVIDIELLYDNALAGVNYQQARKYSLQNILAGSNTNTEGIRMPSNWAAVNKFDYKNIKDIWKKHGKGSKLKSFPGYSMNQLYRDRYIRKIKWVHFLDYMDYNKSEALGILTKTYGYVPYAYKHYESVFTRFYQGYLLPQKFGVDKRKNHLSALIMTGQMSREEALSKLKEIPYESEQKLKEDLQYFLKKFKWTESELEKYIQEPEVPHDHYKSENYKKDVVLKLHSLIKPIKNIFSFS